MLYYALIEVVGRIINYFRGVAACVFQESGPESFASIKSTTPTILAERIDVAHLEMSAAHPYTLRLVAVQNF